MFAIFIKKIIKIITLLLFIIITEKENNNEVEKSNEPTEKFENFNQFLSKLSK